MTCELYHLYKALYNLHNINYFDIIQFNYTAGPLKPRMRFQESILLLLVNSLSSTAD